MAYLDLTFFGAFQAVLDGRLLTHFRSANVEGLLVYLALQAERAFARDVLATLFWPDEPEQTARANLRQSLYQLRKVLNDDADAQSPFLLINRHTVQFNPAGSYGLDVARFRQALQQNDWATALTDYTGELLPGFNCDSEPFEEWLLLEREELQQLAQGALTALSAAQIRQGEFAEAQATARRQLAWEPWHEIAHRNLMQALALAGDRSGALAQFERCYEILEEELGAEPDAATMALYEQIATDVVAVTVIEQLLPQPPTTFVGRVAETGHILQLLNKPDCRILTLVGPGGVGKTRLAIQVAHTFVEQTDREARFVSLLGVTTMAQALGVMAQTLGIAFLDPDQATMQLVGKLKTKVGLLIFDNAEPLLAADDGAFVASLNELSTALPGLRMVVTSRQPLQAGQARTLPIHGLPIPMTVEALSPQQWETYDAIALFRQRAQQARTTFALTTSNIAAVVHLCRQVDGVPLALELAAAQMRHKSVQELVTELAQQPHLLRAELQDLPPRHRSLHNVFAQSWRLLTTDEQQALAQAALFRGSFTRAAAHAVLGDSAQYLESLVEKSLLTRRHATDAFARVRYTMPAALQAFLQAPPDFSPPDLTHPGQESISPVDREGQAGRDARNRHAAYYLAWAVEHQAHLTIEHANLLAAWRWAQTNPAIAVPPQWRAAWLDTAPLAMQGKDGEVEQQAMAHTTTRPAQLWVGRDTELAQLRSGVHRLLHDRVNGGLIIILGEAGMGKSHLVAQVRAATPQITWFSCSCEEDSAQSLLPFRHWLRDYFAQRPGQTTQENRVRFAGRFADLVQATRDPELAAELSHLRSLLAALVDLVEPDSLYSRLQPEQRHEHFTQAIKALLKAESLQQPLLLHLEDAHWIDMDSHALLGSLLRHTTPYPFAIVVTARPERFAPLTRLDAPQQTIRLTAFDRSDVYRLAEQRLASAPDEPVIDLLVAKGGGNPFFTEQLLHYLLDYGLVVDGKLVQRDGVSPADTLLPLEIHNVLTARLNHLAPTVHDVVKRAAVLGQEFPVAVLQELVGSETSLTELLTDATDAAIWQPLANDRYLFRHALLHEAAYTNQVDQNRRQLHEQAARAVAAVATPEQPHYATIAYHYDEAKETQQAVQNYLQAGDEARKNYFLREAHRYYSRGLALAERDTERLPLYLGREAVNQWLSNREEQREDLRQLVGLTAASTDQGLLVDVMLRQATFALETGDYTRAIDHAQQAARTAAAIDRDLEAQAYHRWGRALWLQFKPGAARPLLKRALRLTEAATQPMNYAQCLYDLGMIEFYANAYEEARRQLQEAIPLFDAHGDRRNVIRCLDLLGLIAINSGNFEVALAYCIQTVEQCRAIDWPYGEARMLLHLGDCYFELGDYTRCREAHQRSLLISEAHGDPIGRAASIGTIGQTYRLQGDLQRAQEHFTTALALFQELNHPFLKAYVLTHLGLVYTDLEELEQAGNLLFDALAIRSEAQIAGPTADTDAALAWLDMARGDADLASERALEVMEWLQENGTTGVELPLQVYWQCYTILNLGGRLREAQATLHAAYALLQTLAQRIQDDELRQQYLTKIPHHARLTDAHRRIMKQSQ